VQLNVIPAPMFFAALFEKGQDVAKLNVPSDSWKA
jgi:hypothetical protein